MDWREYQEQIASLFRDLACQVALNHLVQGARGRHRADVRVEFMQFGLPQVWIVECKHWKTAVTKEKVLALQALLQDVGADRGILASESGFQAGAIAASSYSNIILTSLQELRDRAKDHLMSSTLWRIEQQLDELARDLHSLIYVTEQTGQNSSRSYPNPIFDTELTGGIFANLSILSTGVKQARFGDFPAVISFAPDHRTPVFAESMEAFVQSAIAIIESSETVWNAEKKRVEAKQTANPSTNAA
jgi:hypothetical protein